MQKKEENGILITLAPPGSMNLAAFFFNTRVIYRLQKNHLRKKRFSDGFFLAEKGWKA